MIPSYGPGVVIREILYPDGNPIGQPGRGRGVRCLPGDLPQASLFFEEFRLLGRPAPIATLPGERIWIPDAGFVVLRPVSQSGEPTVQWDANIEAWVGFKKIKFVGYGNAED